MMWPNVFTTSSNDGLLMMWPNVFTTSSNNGLLMMWPSVSGALQLKKWRVSYEKTKSLLNMWQVMVQKGRMSTLSSTSILAV